MIPSCQGAVNDIVEIEELTLKPCVPMYGPINITGLKPGQTKLWCTCGLSKKQPWCDASHKGTNFKPLKWVVPGTLADGKSQTRYSICNCKYTKAPPYCDAAHTDLPCKYLGQQEECSKDHTKVEKLCEGCGYAPVNPYLEGQS